MPLRTLLLLSAPFLLVACAAPPEPALQAPEVGVFEPAPCPVEFPGATESIRCGYVRVPESHGQPGDRTLRIAVAIFSALGEEKQADPLVVAPAGPGTSAIAGIGPDVAGPIGQPLRASRDVVLIENRGLPLSEPALLCEEVVESSYAGIGHDVRGEEALDIQAKSLRLCYERLQSQGVNVRAFTFDAMADDMALILTALGYDRFNLYGTSAGTVLAQHLLRKHPQRLRSVIMDSAVPLGRAVLQAEMPANAARVLHSVFQACADQPACAEAYPDVESRFDAVVQRLNEQPVTVQGQSLHGEDVIDVVFNGDRFASTLFMASAQTPWLPQLPGVIHALAEGNDERLKELAWGAMPPPGHFSHGIGPAALCPESFTYGDEDIIRDGRYPAFEEAVVNLSWGPRALTHNCPAWEYERMDAGARVVPTSDVPTLILAGQWDAITPPGWAHDTARPLSRGRVVEVPGYGHSPTFAGGCTASLALAFLAAPEAELDESCIQDLQIDFVLPPQD